MEGIVHYPASAETCIAFDDYRCMGREEHTSVYLKNSPRWAMSDEKLRILVAHKICITAGVVEVPTTLEALRKVEETYMLAARANAAKPGAVESQKHVETILRFGGPLAFFTSLLYRRYRLSMDSPELARQFGITPQNVRQQINRCSLIARSLFPDPEDHLPWNHRAKDALKAATILPKQRRFGVPRARTPKFCIVCGKEVPKRHYKFCGKRCFKFEKAKSRKEARKAGNPRPVLCSADCKVSYSRQQPAPA